MDKSFCGILMAAALLAGAWPAAAQAVRGRTSTLTMSNPVNPARVQAQPYTAEYKITRVVTLGNGATITNESTEVVAMDSQGRRMTATTRTPTRDRPPQTMVNVYDPTTRTHTNWNVPGKRATALVEPAQGTTGSPCVSEHVAPRPSAVREKPTTEDLGTETIQGLEAHGRRITRTTPAGAIGNDQPLVHTDEVWDAVDPALRGLLLRQVTDDPQSGRQTRELASLTQGEPDASAFQPPEGYELVTQEMQEMHSCGGTTNVVPPPPTGP